jgi:hypothetical protein
MAFRCSVSCVTGNSIGANSVSHCDATIVPSLHRGASFFGAVDFGALHYFGADSVLGFA